MLDIHAHLLPGVDDGARSWEEAVRMLEAAREAGVTELVATPHLLALPPNESLIRTAYEKMTSYARSHGISLWKGYEVYYPAVEALDDVRPFCVQWKYPENIMLLEFREPEVPERAEGRITQWVRQGVTPVIVHPERYAFVQKQPDMLQAWRNYGCLIQVDAGGLAAPFLSRESRTAHALIRMGLVDFIASDAHRPAHYVQYARVMRKMKGQWTGVKF